MMVTAFGKWMLATCVMAACAVSGWAADRPAALLPGVPDNDQSAGLLGELFESKAAGISFRAPANSREIRKPGVPDFIVEYVDEENQMVLKVGTLQLREPRPLGDWKDQRGTKRPGLLEETANAFVQQNPTAAILRREIGDANGLPVGLAAYRYNQQTRKLFRQDAIIPLTDTYSYSFTMISQGAKESGAEVDSKERLAAEIFREVLDTVKLYDRSDIAKDQELRMARSTALLEKLKGGGGRSISRSRESSGTGCCTMARTSATRTWSRSGPGNTAGMGC